MQYFLIPVITQISIYQLTFIRHRIRIHNIIHIWSGRILMVIGFFANWQYILDTLYNFHLTLMILQVITNSYFEEMWVSVTREASYSIDRILKGIGLGSTAPLFFYSYDPTGDREQLLWREDCICDSYCMFKKSCLF